MVALVSVPAAIAAYYIWPFIAGILQGITRFIGESGLFGTFVFGTLDKALLPFGIHHLIAFPIEYSSVGGTMTIDGVLYEGVRNIINGQAASASATGYLVRNFTTGRLLFQMAGLPGAAFAMYRCAKKENRKKVAALLVPTVFTLAMVGVSEPSSIPSCSWRRRCTGWCMRLCAAFAMCWPRSSRSPSTDMRCSL